MPELIPAAPLTPEWHAARRLGVTATDIVTILGLSSYDSVYSLFWRKLGQVPDTEDNDRFRLGRELEEYAVRRWHEEHWGYGGKPSCLYQHSERTWQLATIDREIWRGTDLPYMPLEVKTWADADRHAWDDGPPARVRAQVLWQMDVMDVAAGHVGVVFLPSGEFRSYVIEHDSTCSGKGHALVCSACDDQELMRQAGLEFMARLRLELPPPDPDSSAATLAAVRARFTKVPDKEAEIKADDWQQVLDFREAMARDERMMRAAEVRIREQAGEASVLTVDGQPVARRVVSDAQVKAHTRHSDYLRRITPRGDDDA